MASGGGGAGAAARLLKGQQGRSHQRPGLGEKGHHRENVFRLVRKGAPRPVSAGTTRVRLFPVSPCSLTERASFGRSESLHLRMVTSMRTDRRTILIVLFHFAET